MTTPNTPDTQDLAAQLAKAEKERDRFRRRLRRTGFGIYSAVLATIAFGFGLGINVWHARIVIPVVADSVEYFGQVVAPVLVEDGDTLGSIVQKAESRIKDGHANADETRAANGLKGDKIKKGQVLNVPVSVPIDFKAAADEGTIAADFEIDSAADTMARLASIVGGTERVTPVNY